LACQVGIAQFGVQRLEIAVDPDNIASRRVAMRNGFQETGMRNGRILHVRDMSLPGTHPDDEISHADCEDARA
jgi:RimJ/RimL family protein N-acetyltransferase